MNTYQIQAGGMQHQIQMKGQKVIIDGNPYKLKDLPNVKKALLFYEYTLPIQGAQVLLVTGLLKPELVVNGAYAGSGKAYIPLQDAPGWIYIFVVLNAINLLNGAIGGLFGALGALTTLKLGTNPQIPTGLKVLYSILILIGCWAAVIIIAMLLYLLVN